jgi:hypothetical protein
MRSSLIAVFCTVILGSTGWAGENRLQSIMDVLAVTEPSLKMVLEKLSEERFADISHFCDGRLTLGSGSPYAADSFYQNQTQLYFTPYVGSRVGIYDGAKWEIVPFSEISITPTLTASKVYDVFVYNNSGTLTLELSAAWTTDTTRADALTTVAGVLVKSSNNSRRFVGTIRANASGSMDDNRGSRLVWNECNKKRRFLSVFDLTFHSYDGPYRLYNGSTDSKIDLVIGQPTEVQIQCEFQRYPYSATTYAGFGINSTSTPVHQTGSTEGQFAVTAAGATMQLGIGLQTINMINSTNSTGTMDVYLQKLQGWIEN